VRKNKGRIVVKWLRAKFFSGGCENMTHEKKMVHFVKENIFGA
jgi:hypothetical protein